MILLYISPLSLGGILRSQTARAVSTYKASARVRAPAGHMHTYNVYLQQHAICHTSLSKRLSKKYITSNKKIIQFKITLDKETSLPQIDIK